MSCATAPAHSVAIPLTNLALAQRLERVEALNTAGYAWALQAWQADSVAAVQEIGDGLATFTRPNFPMNRAVGLGLSTPPPANALSDLEAFYAAHGVPSQVVVCPFTHPDVFRMLGQRNYAIDFFFNVHVRAVVPSDASFALPDVAPDQLRISVVESAGFDVWAQTNIRTSHDPAREPAPIADDDLWLTVARTAVRRPNTLGFIAWINDEPAGSAALSMHEGVATMFSAGTRIPFRRRGIQRALLQARLAEAYRRGCDLAHITTTPGSDSQRNVQRHGFALAYQRMVMRREG